MNDKSLIEKAIDFKGKKYILVADRVLYFNDAYKDGSITTELVSAPDADMVVVKATVKPNDKQTFTGYSQATWGEGYINKTSALENCETSAVGRALAFMGIGVIESIASIDEINKTTYPARTKVAEVKMSPEVAKANARIAIEGANNLDVLMEVEKNVKKSKNLTDQDKEELSFLAGERRNDFDPTQD